MRKQIRRAWAMLVALVLLVSMIPTAAAAPNTIEYVEIKSMPLAAEGEHPQMEIWEEFEEFTIARDQYNDQNITWLCTDETDPHEMKPYETFRAGADYRVVIGLEAGEGYSFPAREMMSGSIGGNSSVVFRNDGNGSHFCTVSLDMKALERLSGGIHWNCNGRYSEQLSYYRGGKLDQLSDEDISLALEWSEDQTAWNFRKTFSLTDCLYPEYEMLGKYIRITVTGRPDRGYTGKIVSEPLKILPDKNYSQPETPRLTTEAPYDTVKITNYNTMQQYVWSYRLLKDEEIDWDRNPINIYDGCAEDLCPGETVYIYTRFGPAPNQEASPYIAYSCIYMGKEQHLSRIVAPEYPMKDSLLPVIYIPVGGKMTLDLMKEPSNANTWNKFRLGVPYGTLSLFSVSATQEFAAPEFPDQVVLTAGSRTGSETLTAYYMTNTPQQYGSWTVKVYDPQDVKFDEVRLARPLHLKNETLWAGDIFYPAPLSVQLQPKEANTQFTLGWYVYDSVDSITGIPSLTQNNGYLSVDHETGVVTALQSMDAATPDCRRTVALYAEKKGVAPVYLASYEITVKGSNPYEVPAESVRITPPALRAEPGAELYLNAEVLPTNAADKGLIWTSGDAAVATAGPGGLVKINAKAPAGARVVITAATGSGIKGTCTVTVKGADSQPLPFTDVPENQWFYPYVEYVYLNGIMSGHSSDRFAPNQSLTRAQLAQILYNLAGQPLAPARPVFSDVKPGNWFFAAVNWAAGKGYVKGYPDGSFGPNSPLTREQLATILFRHSQMNTVNGSLDSFKDAGKTSSYARKPLTWAVEHGIVNGLPGDILAPGGKATRAQVAKMIMCYMENVVHNSFLIMFDSQGGSRVEPLRVMNGAPIHFPAPPVREGYEFVCWITESGMPIYEGADNLLVTGTLKLFANWRAVP